MRLEAARAHAEACGSDGVDEAVADDAVGAGVEARCYRVVVGEGEGGEGRADAFGLDAAGEKSVDIGQELRVALHVIGAKAVH